MASPAESSGDDSEAANMFASVWVKVEVQDFNEVDTEKYTEEDDQLYKPSAKKRVRKTPKTMLCDQCDYSTVYGNCMKVHQMGHSNTEPHKCDKCGYSTKYKSLLQRHEAMVHAENIGEEDGMYPCDECDYKTNYKWNLKAHKRKHSSEKKYKCNECPYETAYRNNYTKHCRKHTNEKETTVYKCDKCTFESKFEGHITRHLAKIHHEVTTEAKKCDFCNFFTRTKWRLNIHIQRSKRETMTCPHCEFQTQYNCQMKIHKHTHFPERSEVLSNIAQRFQTNDYGILNPGFHAKETTGNDNQCDETSENYDSNLSTEFNADSVQNSEYLNSETGEVYIQPDKHSKAHQYSLDPTCVEWSSIQVLESNDKDRPFLCQQCSYTSKFKGSVQRHYQRHHTGSKNRPYKCNHCDFSTKTKDQIALHNKRSQMEQEIVCKVCEFKTMYKCLFVLHQKCHYPLKCKACDYTCKHHHELQRHYSVTHMGNGLKCQFCDYTAKRKESLLCHEAVHTGEKPFKCSQCDYSSIRKSLLRNHVVRNHNAVSDFTVVSPNKIQSLKVVKDGDNSSEDPSNEINNEIKEELADV